jgi:hypothetical protein
MWQDWSIKPELEIMFTSQSALEAHTISSYHKTSAKKNMAENIYFVTKFNAMLE